jgi:hypothetical protein
VKNTIILLYGYPATGKLTVARELEKISNAILVDNHLVANPLFQIVRADGQAPLPEAIWGFVARIRDVVLDAIINLSAADDSFIFTNCLYEEYSPDHDNYDKWLKLAEQRGAKFIPVMLTCPLEILKQRVGNPDRAVRMKLTSTPELDRLYKTYSLINKPHPNLITLNTSQHSAAEIAKIILERMES